MRHAYNQDGVEGFYLKNASSYRNPHFEQVVRALGATLTEVFGGTAQQEEQAGGLHGGPGQQLLNPHQSEEEATPEVNTLKVHEGGPLVLRALDLACGSGEASLALHAWLQQHPPGQQGGQPAACPAASHVGRLLLTAADPYTASAFRQRTGLPRAVEWSFEDVQQGRCLGGRRYDVVLCSFAMHLLGDTKLYGTLYALSMASRWLVLISPHKRPIVKPGCGWQLVGERVVERVHVRVMESCNTGMDT